MKRIFYFFGLVFITSLAVAQAPQLINYQGIARNSNGSIVTLPSVGVRFDIHQGSPGGTIVFSETHPSAAINPFGLFNLQIGSITALAVNWDVSIYYLEVSIDTGSGFNPAGPPQQLVSVPYALYAKQTPAPAVSFTNNVLTINGSSVAISSATFTPPSIIGTGITTATYNSGTSSYSINTDAPVLTGNGNVTISGTYPNYLISVPSQSLSFVAPNTIMLSGGGGAITIPGTISGDVSGNLGSSTVTALQNIPVSASTPTAGQVLQFNGTNWVPANVSTGGVTTVNTAGPLTGGPITSSGTLSMSPSGVTPGTYGSAPNNIPVITVDIYGRITNANTIAAVTTPTNLTGDVQGPITSNTVTAIQTKAVSAVAPLNGQALMYNGSVWTPSALPAPAATSIQINSPHTANTISANNYSITVAPTSITAAGVASVSGTYPNFVVSVPSPSLSIAGNSLTITQGTATSTQTLATGPWTKPSGTVVALNTSTDLVGIGTTVPSAHLEIVDNAGSSSFGVSNSSTASYIASYLSSMSSLYTTRITNDGSGHALVVMKGSGATAGSAARFDILGSGNSADVIYANTPGTGAALSANNTGSGMAITATQSGPFGSIASFNSTNASNNTSGITVNKTGGGEALYSTSSGTSSAMAGRFQKNGAGGWGLYTSHSGASGTAAFFELSNASNSGQVITAQTSGTGDVMAAYAGSGRAYYGSNNGSAQTMLLSNSGSGYAIHASNTTTVGGASNAGYMDGGLDIRAKGQTGTSVALNVMNSAYQPLIYARDDGKTGVGIGSPGYRLHVYEDQGTSPALYSSNQTTISSSAAHGVVGITGNSNGLAAGIFGQNTGPGPAVYGFKNASENGIAGKFEIQNTSNSADAVFALNNGSGAAVHAASGTAASSAIALLLENGHVRSIGNAPTTTSVAIQSGFTSLNPSCSNCTDVKGKVTCAITATSVSSLTGLFRVSVNFNKNYTTAPSVVIIPCSDPSGLTVYVSAVSTTSFQVTFQNQTNGTLSGLPPNFSFNYIVIE